MSDQETSSEPKVASSETPSAPSPVAPTVAEPAAFPTFGTSRGSGLARGKRAASAAPAAATKNESAGEYKPTAIQVVTTEREYKNPFAAETPSVPEAAPVAASPVNTPSVAPVAVEAPAAAAPAPTPTLAAPTPIVAPASVESNETKAELKILPPEQRQQAAQSWESSSFPENKNAAADTRPTFRPERREPREPRENRDQRENVAGRESFANGEGRERDFRRDNRGPRENRENRDPRDNREPRQPRDPRDQREPRAPRENRGEFREQREPRPLAARPLPTPPAPQKKGFFGWLKNLFAGSPEAEKAVENPASQRGADERHGEDGQRRHHHHRGGRGRGGYRNDQRGPRENREGGPNPNAGGEHEGGERRFEGGHRRRRHRGGRGRGGFDNRQGGGDSRPDQGGGSGNTNS